MNIHLTTRDGVPIYRQIVNQVKYLVACGRMATGEELPPIRVLAEELVINPNTVARAYADLEREGVVTKRHGAGTYVSDQGQTLRKGERLRILGGRIDALLAEASALEVGLEELIELVQQRGAKMKSGVSHEQ